MTPTPGLRPAHRWWGLLGSTLESSTLQGFMMLCHSVFFRLKDRSPAAIAALVAGCREHLSGHPGEVVFAVGTCSSYDRHVNDLDWQVALHIVFDSHAAHDAYQQAPRHEVFIAAHADAWERVRVFDADLSACDTGGTPG